MIASVTLNNTTLYYRKSGYGEKALLAFHGFGQNGSIYDELAHELEDRYTIYSFDLFFHGISTWPDDEQPLEKEFWKAIIKQLLIENNIETLSVLGFSMGGKFALATLEAFPQHTQEIILIAPDGIKTSFWYSLATYPVAFRNLFKSMIQKPERFNAIIQVAYKLRLVDNGILRFVESQMNTEEKRNRVYFSWVVFRHLKFDMTEIANFINNHEIKLVMITGKYDKIITTKNMSRLLSNVKHYTSFTPETGHNGVIQASIKILK